MAVIDIRSHVEMEKINNVLLNIAEQPFLYVDLVGEKVLQSGWEHRRMPAAAQLARQASASVICNCVAELWSCLAACLHALEPDFPLDPPSVSTFLKETRLPAIYYFGMYYKLCKKEFKGTNTYQNLDTLVDLRNEIEHDKTETTEEYSATRIKEAKKWIKRLEPLIGRENLLWLPKLQPNEEMQGFTLGGEPIVMKFMKYPVAKWALKVTRELTKEMKEMMFSYQGKKRTLTDGIWDEAALNSFRADEKLIRLWYSAE